MIENAFYMGITPQQLYDMELWEYLMCQKAFKRRGEDDANDTFAATWQTAYFSGAAFAGKLRKLKYYQENANVEKAVAPKISRDKFEQKLKEAKEANAAENA